MNWLDGKKTYIIGFGIILGSAFLLLTQWEITDVPDFVWLIINGLGLAALRVGIQAVSENDNKGWKSYVAAGAIVALGGLKMAGIEFPVEVLVALEGLGLIGIRDAVNKIEKV
jgi:hypothetical protein